MESFNSVSLVKHFFDPIQLPHNALIKNRDACGHQNGRLRSLRFEGMVCSMSEAAQLSRTLR